MYLIYKSEVNTVMLAYWFSSALTMMQYCWVAKEAVFCAAYDTVDVP